jgi:uncharacterized protein with ATP-grasp and redox domains
VKVDVECAPCLLYRGYRELSKATDDMETRFQVMEALLKLEQSEFGPEAVPAVLGTKRDRLIKVMTGVADPYQQDKKRSNSYALMLYPGLRERVLSKGGGWGSFSEAVRLSILGNSIEMDVLDHNFSPEDISRLVEPLPLGIDTSKEIFELAKKSKSVLFICDNAGEIVFDRILVERIKELGARCTVAVKEGPVLNDATLLDAHEAGLDEVADEIITTGSDSVGVFLEDSSEKFREVFEDSGLVVAKGMGNYETLTEESLSVPVAHLLLAKCDPVARSIGVKRGEGAASIRVPTVR